MLPSNLEGGFVGMSDDEKATLLQYNSNRSINVPQARKAMFPALDSSQLRVTPQPATNYPIDNMRLNPFPPEFGRQTEEAVKDNVPDQQFSTSALTVNNLSLQPQHHSPFSVPPPGFGNNPPVSTIISNPSVSVPDGSGFMKYRTPDVSSLGSDRNAGHRFDPTTGLHYDANTGLFFNPALCIFLRWNPLLNTYLRVDGPGLGAPSGSRLSNFEPGIHSVVPQLATVPSALQGSISPRPVDSSNVRPPQDEFMNEIWDRMRRMAKEVIDDTKPGRNTESSSDSDVTSSSSSTSPNRSYKKNRNKRVSRSRSSSGNYRKNRRKRSVSKGRRRSSLSREFEKMSSKMNRRRSNSRGRRSRSRSPAQRRRHRSRSRSKRRSRSRSLDRNRRKNWSRSSGRPRRIRSRSRSNSKGHSRGKRSVSRSPHPRDRRRKNRSPRTSRSPSVKNKRRRHGKTKKSASNDRQSPASTSKRHGLDSEKSRNSEPNKSRDGVNQDDSDLSEFDFLKDALVEDNQSVEECEEVLDYDYIPESKSPDPTGKTPEPDNSNPLGYLFNDNQKCKHVIVAPVPRNRRSAITKLLGNLESAEKLKFHYAHSSFGAPCDFISILFTSTEAASQWYDSHGGSLTLFGKRGSRMKSYLHFSKNKAWSCKSCKSKNVPMRELCFRCYRHRNPSAFSPVSISKEPTKWVGMLEVHEYTTESVLRSLPPLHDFNIQSTQVVKEPSGIPLGLCVFEVQSVEEGTRLSAFLSGQAKHCVYVIVNEKPVENAAPDKSSENGNVGNVAGSNDQISKCPPGTVSSLTGGNDKEGDRLARLFVDKPTKTILVYIKFSHKSKELKSELAAAETFFRKQLDDDGVPYYISFHIDRKVGAPCCYGLIEFPDAETATEWRAKRGRAFSISVESRKSVLTLALLHFSEKNWSCPSCDLSNFPLRSLCHRCFDHKEGKSGPIALSMITTKWVATSNVPRWFREDENIIAALKKELNDFRLARIYILRDPDSPAFPQGCVLETGGWGESLRLREFLQRTGRFAVFATTTSEFVRYTSPCPPDEGVDHQNLARKTTENDPSASSTPVAESSSLTTKVPALPDAIQELVPNKPEKECLSWWIKDSTKYSSVLNHFFVENPLTRVTSSRTVFVGPLPRNIKFKTLQRAIRSQLALCNIKFIPTIPISVSVKVGAPCNYALVTCETPENANALISKFSAGLIVYNDEERPKGPKSFKTCVYLSKPNWICRNCPTVNFGLRSTCFSCLKSNDKSPDILTLTDTPTSCVCVKNFQRRFMSPELLSISYPRLNLGSRCFFKVPTEKSGVPLGVCVLEMENSDDARLLFSELDLGKISHYLCYGVWGKSNCESEESGNPNQVGSKEESCDGTVEMGVEKASDEKESLANEKN